MLLCLGSLALLFLERFLVERPPTGLVLAKGVLVLLLVLARVILALDLGAVGDEVVRVSAVKVALLLLTTTVVLIVVREPLELVDHQR
jgi:hypothetical protein